MFIWFNSLDSEGHTYSYQYDAAGNQITAIDNNGTTSYDYDRLNRLASVTEPDGTITDYSFDKAGNRLSKTVTKDSNTATTTYVYDERNRLLSENTIDAVGNLKNTTYKYDPNGNLIYQSDEVLELVTAQTPEASFGMFIIGQGSSEELDYGLRMYEYDSFNRLVVATANGDKAIYTYDGLGRRVAKKINNETTKYLYNGDRIILEKAGNGDLTRNIYGSNLIGRDDGTDIAYYWYDGHGDVVGLRVNGVLRAEYEYDAFGNAKTETYYDASGVEVPTALISTPYRYNGYFYDEETGNYFLNARYYNPGIGRFISEDNYRGRLEFTLSLNLYTYCSNEPIMYRDPSGHFQESDKEFDEETQEKLHILSELYYDWHNKTLAAESEADRDKYRKLRDSTSEWVNKVREEARSALSETAEDTKKSVVKKPKSNTSSKANDEVVDIYGPVFNPDYGPAEEVIFGINYLEDNSGGRVESKVEKRLVEVDLGITHYRQNDPRWGSENIYDPEERNKTMARVGCTITCCAMVLDEDPLEHLNFLKENNIDGLYNWQKVANLKGKHFESENFGNDNDIFEEKKEELYHLVVEERVPVIGKLRRDKKGTSETRNHYIVIDGFKGELSFVNNEPLINEITPDMFIIKDPLRGDSSLINAYDIDIHTSYSEIRFASYYYYTD